MGIEGALATHKCHSKNVYSLITFFYSHLQGGLTFGILYVHAQVTLKDTFTYSCCQPSLTFLGYNRSLNHIQVTLKEHLDINLVYLFITVTYVDV